MIGLVSSGALREPRLSLVPRSVGHVSEPRIVRRLSVRGAGSANIDSHGDGARTGGFHGEGTALSPRRCSGSAGGFSGRCTHGSGLRAERDGGRKRGAAFALLRARG